MDKLLGPHAVEAALEEGRRPLERLLVQRQRRDRRLLRIVELARRHRVPVRFEDRTALDRLAGGERHQGVVALAAAARYSTEEQILAGARSPAFLLVLDGIEDPRNLGAVIRCAAAAGVDGILLPERGAVGVTPAAQRAAAGAAERVPLARVKNSASLLVRLRERGIWLAGLHPGGAPLWTAIQPERPLALVLGGEGRGLRRLLRERCDTLLGIPMPGGGGSLNLSVAAGLALFEVVRGRRNWSESVGSPGGGRSLPGMS